MHHELLEQHHIEDEQHQLMRFEQLEHQILEVEEGEAQHQLELDEMEQTELL